VSPPPRRPRAPWVGALGLLLVGCIATGVNPSPAPSAEATSTVSAPAVATRAAPPITTTPAVDPPSATLFLPDEFAPAISYVSPDGRFVAARARDEGRVVLYRITTPSPRASILQLTEVAQVRGFIHQISWLEDSSAVLVGTDLDPTHTIKNHDPTGAGRRIAILNTDGRTVIAPATAKQVLYHRAQASSDGRWVSVSDQCCDQQLLLLSRDGTEVRRVVGPEPAGVFVGFAGWDRDGLVLYSEIREGGSALVAVDVGGAERYRISAPNGYGNVYWGIAATAPDRSWQLVELRGGMGSSFRAHHLLVGRDLRSLPDRVTDPQFGPLSFGDEIVYADPNGTLRAYQPLTERDRAISLQLDLSHGPSTLGISDGYFVWMELATGYVGDLRTGRTAKLPLQRRLNASIVEGARLAEYRFDDNAIVIYDLAAIAKP
jgi:hypothetical protein